MSFNGQDNKIQSHLKIFSKTWSRDSHGLYDYESQQAKPLDTFLSDNSLITRRKLDLRVISTFDEIKEDEYLLEAKYDKFNDKYYINHAVPSLIEPNEKNISELQNKLWYVIKNDETATNNTSNNQTIQNKNEDYFINLNDIIKLGRVKYAANEINIKKPVDMMDVVSEIDPKQSPYNISQVNQGSNPIFDFIYKTNTPHDNQLDEVTCKYCLSGGSDADNPLVELCKCTGGIKYSHYICLKMWMQTKLSKKENEKGTVTSYNIKAFNCEICKTPYPFRFIVNGNLGLTYDLIEILRPENQNYIILESLNQLKDNNNLKSIHVIVLQDQKITLGRGHESDVRINDISVSRTHAVLHFNQLSGKILIRDLKSKFGTLALLKNNVQVREKKLHLQIGRSYLEVNIVNSKDYEKYKTKLREKKNSGIQSMGNPNNPNGFFYSNTTIVGLGAMNPNLLNGNFPMNNNNNNLNDQDMNVDDIDPALIKRFMDDARNK